MSVSGAHRIVPRPGGTNAPLSSAQERLWTIDRLMPGTPQYNVPWELRLSGAVDSAALEAALTGIVRRHESLRTIVGQEGETPCQRVQPPRAFGLRFRDLQGVAKSARDEQLQALVETESAHVFDLARGPLLRGLLVTLEPQSHVLLVTVHHIVFDGWSFRVFLEELDALYTAFRAGQDSPLADPDIQYADFAAWERAREGDARRAGHLAYWVTRLQGELPVLSLPVDHPAPARRTHRGGCERAALPPDVVDALTRIGSRAGATPFMVLLTALKVLLFRYTGQQDILVACPIADRMHPQRERAIGFFVNTLLLRTQAAGDLPFVEYLERVSSTCCEAFEHQETPFQDVVDAIAPDRATGLTPLFQVIFSYEDLSGVSARIGDLDLCHVTMCRSTALTDLVVIAEARPEGMTLGMNYSADVFDGATARRMLGHWCTLLEAVARSPQTALDELPLAPAAQELQVMAWGRAPADYERDATVHGLLSAQAEATPEAEAAVAWGRGASLTYAALNRQANRVAHYLRGLGVKGGDRVGLCFERSLEMLTAILGVLKAGAAYVPLPADYPAGRLSLMIDDTGIRVILAQDSRAGNLPAFDGRVIRWTEAADACEACCDADPGAAAGPGDLCYVMYTSGSTGRPKGVMVPHRGVVRLVRNTNYAGLDARTRMLHMAPVTFDASTLELWGPLLNGGTVVMLPEATPSLADIGSAIRDGRVNTLFMTSELFRAMVDESVEALAGVGWLMAGGDVLPVAQVERVLEALPACRMTNVYGPTENTTYSTYYPVPRDREWGASLPIGRPIANSTVYILDAHRRPVPIGVEGDLWTGGDGVALGYVKRPELTAEVFASDPFSETAGARMYRTGDRARWRADGQVEFMGREDRQVKIRGFRVEPGEIEAALDDCVELEQAVVAVHEIRPGEHVLAAYYVAKSGTPVTVTFLRSFLRGRLPDYMIPQYFMEMTALPTTPHGKLDRRALPLPTGGRPTASGRVAPRTPAERLVAEIWEKLLGREHVDVRDNFFEIGGHSLLAIRAAARVREQGIDVTPNDMLFATLEQIAAAPSPEERDEASRESLSFIRRIRQRFTGRSAETAS